jgi:hypothetical protein
MIWLEFDMEKQEKHRSKVTEPSAALRVQTTARTRIAASPRTEPTPASSNDEDFAAILKGRRGIGPVELMCRIDEIRHLLLVCDGDVAKEQALCELLGVEELESLRLVLTIQALKAVYKEENSKEEKSKEEKSKGEKSS